MSKESESKLSPEEIIRSEIERKITARVDATKDYYVGRPAEARHMALYSMLTNFVGKLPSDRGENWSLRKFPEQRKQILEDQKLTRLELMNQMHPKAKITKEKLLSEGYSEYGITKTYDEFFRDCREAAKECGVSVEELSRAVDAREDSGDFTPEDIDGIFLPIYIKLRAKGYSDDDLGR